MIILKRLDFQNFFLAMGRVVDDINY